MLQVRFLDTNLYNLILWFFLYSFIGWTIESIVISYENKHLTNRGFLHGPFCMVHGLGALVFYFLLKPLSDNYFFLFIGGLISASVLEFLTAKLMLYVFGAFWWDYSKKPFNYKGILCLESSIGWGVLAVCLFAFIHRSVTGVVSFIPIPLGKTLAVGLVLYLIIDFSYTLYHTRKGGEDMLPENSFTYHESGR